jgi:PAS domain-containing protein
VNTFGSEQAVYDPLDSLVGRGFREWRLAYVGEHTKASEASFIDLLERLTPEQEQMELIERVFRSAWVGRAQTAVTDAAALRRELAKQEERRRRVLEQMADGILSAEDFASLHKSTVQAIADLRERLAFAESEVLDLDSAIEYLTHLLWNTSLVWQTSDLQGEKRIQRRMFPEGLSYGKTGFGTPVTHSIYTLLASDFVDESTLVAPQGSVDIANKQDLGFFNSDTPIDTPS